jgi:hypothetical protein
VDARPKNFYNQGINFSLFSHTNSHTHDDKFCVQFSSEKCCRKREKETFFLFGFFWQKATKSNAVKNAFSVFHSKWFCFRREKPFQFDN